MYIHSHYDVVAKKQLVGVLPRVSVLHHFTRSLKINKFKGFSIIALRLVSGPLLQKSNGTGPSADRQKVLLTARLRVFLFLGFSTSRKTGFSNNFSGIPGNFFELDYFDIFLIFSILDLIFSNLLCCFEKFSLSFPIFSTN